MQVDVGYGAVITPAPIEIVYPTMLDLPAPHLRAYTRETVVAEKFQAIVALSTANSRLKDFYDIAELVVSGTEHHPQSSPATGHPTSGSR